MVQASTGTEKATRVRSQQMLERAMRSIAGGVSSAFRAKAVPHPLYIERGQGSRIFDVDGNEYVDYTLAWGPLILGHAHPAVAAAVADTLEKGWDYGAQHEREIRVAERLVELIPCADRVVFSNTGTEADQIAFRLARMHTGRSRIVRFQGHYHGWIEPRPDTLVLPWNDIAALAEAVGNHRDEIAGVIMEPILCNGGCILPQEGYLSAVRNLTRQHGIVLIFDEVITGFRVHLEGAQGLYGITPDLATFGKAVAAGFPLSVVAGRYQIMKLIETGQLMHGGSFNGNPTVLAAAEATLAELSRHDAAALKAADDHGRRIMEGLKSAAEDAGVPLTVRGLGTVFRLSFPDEVAIADSRGLISPPAGRLGAWLEAMLDRGVYMLSDGRWYVSTVHSDDDLARTQEAARGAFREVAKRFPER